mgnify:CR=1 FL=1
MATEPRPPITSPAEAIVIAISEDTRACVSRLTAAGYTDEKNIMLTALQSAIAIQLARMWAVIDNGRNGPIQLAGWLMACHDDPNRKDAP